MAYLPMSDETLGLIDAEASASLGDELSRQYAEASPFPHIVIDDFLPARVLDDCLRNFPTSLGRDGMTFDRAQERYKSSFNPDTLAPSVRTLFYSLNSLPFIRFLENLTGIKGLIPDPYFMGGGFHQTTNGGHLSVHTDFNLHSPLMLERRLNALIYLNRDWPVSYGGALELWDAEMKTCVKKIAPEFGRCVVFTTTGSSFHGHPDPVAHPEGTPRRSIALYYYTATWDGIARGRTTQFRRRPASDDRFDFAVKSEEILGDFLPPIVNRALKRVAARLSRRGD